MFVVISVAVLVIQTNQPPAYKKGSSSTYDTAVRGALALFQRRTKEGMNMETGPCLTNDLMPDWVVDVVHSPREPSDDFPENQCQAYREGRADHFVELDINGNLVRVR